MTMHVYGLAPMNAGGCHWYRVRQPLAALQSIGHVCDWGPSFDEDVATSHDVIMTHMLHSTVGVTAWGFLRDEGQHTLVFDIDDNVWAWPKGTDHAKYWTQDKLTNLEAIARMSHLVTTPSLILREVLIERLMLDPDRVVVLPNYVPEFVLDYLDPPPDHDGIVIGYQGAPQKVHQRDLDVIQNPLFRILDAYPETRLAFFGQPKPLEGAGLFADRIDFIPWEPSVPDYYASLRARVDIGVGPLVSSPFTECKSAIRMVEFAALGIPAVYSDVDPYKAWVREHAGDLMPWCYLANYQETWYRALERLVKDTVRRDPMRAYGINAAGSWTTIGNIWQWEQAYENSRPARRITAHAHRPNGVDVPDESNTQESTG